MGRILKSRRAISGAVTALILVIVSVVLALAVAVFAFGLFGSFGSSGGQVQVVGTPQVSVTGSSGGYKIIVTLTIKNSGNYPATLQSVSVLNITGAPPTITSSSSQSISNDIIPAGYDGVLTISIPANVQYLPVSLANTNTGGSVPISIAFTEGSLSPTLTTQGILISSTYT